MGGSELEAWVILFDVEDKQVRIPEVGSRHCGCDELWLAFGIFEYSEWFMSPPQADRVEIYVQGGSDGAVVRVLVVMGKIDFLAVILVLLLAPLHAHVADVIDGEIEDVVISEALFPLT